MVDNNPYTQQAARMMWIRRSWKANLELEADLERRAKREVRRASCDHAARIMRSVLELRAAVDSRRANKSHEKKDAALEQEDVPYCPPPPPGFKAYKTNAAAGGFIACFS